MRFGPGVWVGLAPTSGVTAAKIVPIGTVKLNDVPEHCAVHRFDALLQWNWSAALERRKVAA